MIRPLQRWTTLIAAAALAGCTVGPNYARPTAAVQTHFKEADGWTPAHPVDALDKGAWWSMFDDPVLDGLERQVATGNQTLKEYEAAYRQARQVVAEARASFFPTLGIDASAERERSPSGLSGGSIGGGLGTTSASTTTGAGTGTGSTTGLGATSTSSGGGTTRTVYLTELEASWVPDLWGKVRRTVEGDKALAQADAADVANAKLAAEASLAEDYFAVRVLDAEVDLDRRTVAAYRRYLDIANAKYQEGNEARSAVLTAQSQLESAQAALASVGSTRAQMEHAIAVLIGKPPADFSLAAAPLIREVPVAPTGLASTLLERRPDVAWAERQVAAANAEIGVAKAAFFPTLSLSASGGFENDSLSSLFTSAGTLWSLGAQVAETLLDFGARSARVAEARAAYDGTVANYRQITLTAFQTVQDDLIALQILTRQETLLRTASVAADKSEASIRNQYQAGTVVYTDVVTAQATALTARRALIQGQVDRQNGAVALIQALGGGWADSALAKGSTEAKAAAAKPVVQP